MTAEQVCARHGYYLADGPGGLWVYIPVGVDPADGRPLTRARRATLYESGLWLDGRYNELAKCLAQQGCPVKVDRPRRWWQKLRERLLGRGR